MLVRIFVVALALAGTIFAGVAHAGADAIRPDDHVLGRKEAPITMIVYESLTCSHCAAFHRDTFGSLVDNYVTQGKLRIVFRHFPLDGIALRESMVVRCAPKERFLSFMEVFFALQKQIVSSNDPVHEIVQAASQAGMDPKKAKSCMEDEALAKQIVKVRNEDGKTFNLQSTPTFIFAGSDQRVVGSQPLAEFEKILRKLEK